MHTIVKSNEIRQVIQELYKNLYKFKIIFCNSQVLNCSLILKEILIKKTFQGEKIKKAYK